MMHQPFATHIVSNMLCVHCKRYKSAWISFLKQESYEKRETGCTFANRLTGCINPVLQLSV